MDNIIEKLTSDETKVLKTEAISHPSAKQREGPVARSIEQQTAKLPSDLFLWTAMGAGSISLMCKLAGRDREASFVGQWVPTILILGLYNKLVKLHGSDGT